MRIQSERSANIQVIYLDWVRGIFLAAHYCSVPALGSHSALWKDSRMEKQRAKAASKLNSHLACFVGLRTRK